MRLVLMLMVVLCCDVSFGQCSAVPGYQGIFGGIESSYIESDGIGVPSILINNGCTPFNPATLNPLVDALPGGCLGGFSSFVIDDLVGSAVLMSRGFSGWVSIGYGATTILSLRCCQTSSFTTKVGFIQQLTGDLETYTPTSSGGTGGSVSVGFRLGAGVHHLCVTDDVDTIAGTRVFKWYVNGELVRECTCFFGSSMTEPPVDGFMSEPMSCAWDGIHVFTGAVPLDAEILAAYEFIVPPPLPFIRGDADGLGTYSIADAIMILNWVFEGLPLPCDDAGDVNDDGLIDIADSSYLLTFIFNSGSPPPAPYATCGPDPTADSLGCASYSACP